MTDAKVQEVYAGVYLVYLPLPGKPTIVNVYLLHGAGEWALVDTGLNTRDSLAALDAALARVGCRPEALRTILCTHHHPDHFGASGPLKARTGATVWISPPEHASAGFYRVRDRPDEATAFFIRHGLPMERFGRVPTPGEWWGSMYMPAEPDASLEDGAVLTVAGFEIDVVTTPGHTAGHCVFRLRREGALIVGDHLLPKITPHVGVYPGGPRDPLGDFLDSQRKVQGVEAQLVLPAHGGVYRDHRHRAAQIIQHHEYRLREIRDAVSRRPLTAYAAAQAAFGFDADAPLAMQFPATFETLAHLEHLCVRGHVVREDGAAETRYRATGAGAALPPGVD